VAGIILSINEDVGNYTLNLFIKHLADLWELRKEEKKEYSKNSGLLPIDNILRDKILTLIRSSHLIDSDMCIWSDTTKKDFLTDVNFHSQDFYNITRFYQDYVVSGLKKNDIGLKISYENPHNTFRKFDIFTPKKYREMEIYKFHGEYENIEDVLFSNFPNPHNNVTTFLTFYRSGYEEKYFFTEDDRQRQHFILSLLTFDPEYPIAICDESGHVHYRDSDFWEICRIEFPQASVFSELPSKLLANLIRWNNSDTHQENHRFLRFKVVQYKNIYFIQVLNKKEKNNIINRKTINLKKESKEKIKRIDNIKKTGFKLKQSPSVFYQHNDYDDDHLIKNKDVIIEDLERKIEEKNKMIEDLLAQNEMLNKFKVSQELVKLNKLKLPETPPEIFRGKQSQSMEFLEKIWGKYLSYFGAKKNLLFQYKLVKLDKKLATAVRGSLNYQRRKGRSAPSYTEVVPPKSVEIDELIKTVPVNFRSVGIALHGRKFRKKSSG